MKGPTEELTQPLAFVYRPLKVLAMIIPGLVQSQPFTCMGSPAQPTRVGAERGT